ncbi:zinc finger, C3HC4 type [Ancylostoma caninum]|uniref:Zinc finger, C3HC4 type n=1 Tax=Ancylostoma caninum TaxID=29170 RepID=A0A368G2M1_ANCCA|nr:zinc finger, C3HC4 type [Ancylostoma caninum]
MSIGNPKTRCPSDSENSSSIERRACRICQSESGEMVRPCACAGTMGDIHEVCLSRWVAMSNKDQCEICQEKYARSGRTLKSLKNWEKPRIGSEVTMSLERCTTANITTFQEILSLILIAALTYSLIYLVNLCDERLFLERMSSLPVRSDDIGRVC